jgi:Na+/H+ antiporter
VRASVARAGAPAQPRKLRTRELRTRAGASSAWHHADDEGIAAPLDTITIVLVLLLAVVASGFVARLLPVPIPRPLVQIAFGTLIAGATSVKVELDPQIFFLLFVPPLLFLDGWRIPNEELLKDRTAILQLALGLVAITVLGIGLFVAWMIPAMPLAVAFAVAAVVSPTDPIAVTAIAARVPIPRRMMHILEGESLLNDASGLVCLRFAIAAALTGAFSLPDAALSFLWLALGGVAVGVAVTWGTVRIRDGVALRLGEESGSQIIVSLLIPFGSYLLAERLGCSGILAAVASGVTMSAAESSGRTLGATRMRRHSVWETVQFAANGIIFVLLGEQLPAIVGAAAETVRLTGHRDPIWLLGYVGAIYAGLAAIRFAWVWTSLRFTIRRRSGGPARRPGWRLVAAMSLAGVRGAITLAGVLTLPLALADGTPFPARDLAIALAMGVIILSLVVASIGLPLLLRGLDMPDEPRRAAEEDRARVAAAAAAIAAIEGLKQELPASAADGEAHGAAAARLTAQYRSRIAARSQEGEAAGVARRAEAIERRMRLAALEAERETYFRLLREGELGSQAAGRLVREIDLLEARYEG